MVVHSAGGFLLRPLDQTTPADFDAQLAVNLRASFLLARAFLPAMRAAGGGAFVSIGSVADHTGFPENAAYAASKYGLRGLHETLAAEYPRHRCATDARLSRGYRYHHLGPVRAGASPGLPTSCRDAAARGRG